MNMAHNRRTFIAGGAATGASVLALSPLLATIGASSAATAATGGFDFDTPYNRIGTGCVKWDGAIAAEHMSHIVAGMGIADMDFKCAPAIMAALRKRMEHENWGYNSIDIDLILGTGASNPFVKGIIDWNAKRYGINVITPKNLGVTTGVHSGIMATLRAYAPEGSKVLMTTPIYNGFYFDLYSGRLQANESLMKFVNGRYEIDFDDVDKRMSDPATKTMILCNPHNPTGRCWSKAELTRLGEMALKHKVVVLSDEIHCDFVSKGQKYVPFSTLDDKAVVANSITFKSGSKSFSLAGMKCAWFFTTNPEMYKKVAFYNHADLSTLGQIAEEAAYAGGESWLNQCVNYIDGNQQFANDYIKSKIPLIKVGNKPESTYLAWLDVSPLMAKIGAQKMADEANKHPTGTNFMTGKPAMTTPSEMVSHWVAKNASVQISAGSSFGKGGENYMRMNLATNRKTLTAALDSIAAACKTLGA